MKLAFPLYRWRSYRCLGTAVLMGSASLGLLGLSARADDQPVRSVSPYSSDFTSIQRYYTGGSPTYQLNLPGAVTIPGQVIAPGQSTIILTQPIYPVYPRPLPVYPKRWPVSPRTHKIRPYGLQQPLLPTQPGLTFPSAIIQTPVYLYIGPKHPNFNDGRYPSRPDRYPINPDPYQGCWHNGCYPSHWQRR